MALIVVINKVGELAKGPTIKNWVSLLEQEPVIVEIPAEKITPHVKPENVFVSFGLLANRAVNQTLQEKGMTQLDHLELPQLTRLVASPENVDARKDAYKKVQEFAKLVTSKAKVFPNSVIVKEDDLPTLNNQQVLLLKKLATDAGRLKCLQVTKNKKLIEIGPPESWSDEADIHLTFEEIVVLRAAMDVLKVGEVRLVTTGDK